MRAPGVPRSDGRSFRRADWDDGPPDAQMLFGKSTTNGPVDANRGICCTFDRGRHAIHCTYAPLYELT
jgi:hypothetical protein